MGINSMRPTNLTRHGKHNCAGGVLGRLIPIVLILGALGAVGVLGYMRWKKEKPKLLPAKRPVVNVAIEVVKALPRIADAIILPAVVEANRVVDVSAEVSGRIEHIYCDEGKPCKAGTAIMSLNTDLLQADYDRAKAQLEFDVKAHKRMASLVKDGVIPQQTYDEVKSRLDVSKAAMDAAKTHLGRASIFAPIDGILNRIPVEKGEYVQPGTVVAQVVDMSIAKVVVQVPERDIQYFRLHDKARVEFDANGDKQTLTGTIHYISQLADDQTRSTRVEIHVDNKQRLLRSGQIVRAHLTRRVLEKVIMVPLQAIIPLEVGYRIYLVEGDVARQRNVIIGRLIKKDAEGIDRILVTQGLNAGDRLIVSGHRYVGDGQSVKIIEDEIPEGEKDEDSSVARGVSKSRTRPTENPK